MGHEHDRRSGVAADAEQLGLHVLAGHLVERAERFVHQQQLRAERQRSGDGDTLLHATRQLPRPVVGELVELHEPQHLEGPGPTFVLVPALQLQRQFDVAGHGAPLEQPGLLERHAVVAVECGPAAARLAVDRDRAGGRLDQVARSAVAACTCHNPTGRSATRTRRRHRQVMSVERCDLVRAAVVEGLVDPVDLDGGTHALSTSFGRLLGHDS